MKLPRWRPRQDEQLDDEIAAHMRLAIADRVARGEAPDAAERAVRREFGNVTLVKETTREMWGWTALEQLAQDVRYACRTLRKAPGFAAVAVVTLALGIGANSAMFSVINAVLLRPLPFPSPERLVAVSELDLRRGSNLTMSLAYPNYFDWRSTAQSFEHLSSFRESSATLTVGGRSRHVQTAVVSSDFFSTLGVQPIHGRGFRPEDEHAGADVAVVSSELWQSDFGGGAPGDGRQIVLNSRPFTVVGVMGQGFRFPLSVPPTQIWITLAEDARVEEAGDTPITAQRGAHLIRGIGRLRPSATIAAAQAEMETIAAALARTYPDENHNRSARVTPELDLLVGDSRGLLLVLLAAVGCVLLIACVNMANLLLARGAGRVGEMSMRAALGASRRRIVRQLLTESLVLAVAGAVCGLFVAYGSIALIVRVSPAELRGLDEVAIDRVVLAFTLGIAVLSTMLFGLVPALQAARSDATAVHGSVRSTAGRAQRRLRGALVIAETAVGVVLLVGAGLLLRSFDRLLRTPAGFDPSGVATATFRLPDTRYPYRKQVAFYDALMADIRGLPGVQAAAGVPLPLSGTRYTIGFQLDGAPRTSERISADFGMVSPGYFSTMRIPLIRGRDFSEADNEAAPRVVIVNESFARRYFPDVDPIGQRFRPGLQTTEPETPSRGIVGVVGDIRHRSLRETSQPAYYVPYAQGLISPLYIVARGGDSTTTIEQIRKLVARRDSELAVYGVRTMEEYLARSVAAPRFQTLLLAVFAAIGLILTAVGLYGVTAYGVAQRTREFGIRLALGARPDAVLRLVLGGGFTLALVGLAAGIVAAAFATRLLTSALYGVDRFDPATFALVAAVLLVVALAASYGPARRATRVDPIRALRTE